MENTENKWPDEGCILTAHHTGDGWALGVENQGGELVAYLAWPESWPEIMSADDLRAKGFKIV